MKTVTAPTPFEIAVKKLIPTLEFKHTLNNMNPTAVFGAANVEIAIAALMPLGIQPAYVVDGQILCEGELIRVLMGQFDGTSQYDVVEVSETSVDCSARLKYPYYITVNYKDGIDHDCLRCCVRIPDIGVASIWVELETNAFSVKQITRPDGNTDYDVYDDCDIAVQLNNSKILRTNKHNIFKCVRYA